MLRMGSSFSKEALEYVFLFIQNDTDRNAISMVCIVVVRDREVVQEEDIRGQLLHGEFDNGV